MEYSKNPISTLATAGIIFLIVACSSTTSTIKAKKDNQTLAEIQQRKYQTDSIKYGKQCADFIVELDAVFYLNTRGEMITNIAIDSFLNQNIDCIKKIRYPDIVWNKDKVDSFFRCDYCGSKLNINYKEFLFDRKIRYLRFRYSIDSSGSSKYGYTFKGEGHLRNDDIIVH